MTTEDLLELAVDGGADERLLGLLVEEYRTLRKLTSAVVYIEEGGVFKRVTPSEGPFFPSEVDNLADLDLPYESFAQAGLVYSGEQIANSNASSRVLIAIAIAARALRVDRLLKKQRFEVNYRGVELEALYDVGLAITSTLKLEGLGEQILLRAASLLDARQGALYLSDAAEFRLVEALGGEARKRIPRGDPQVEDLLVNKPCKEQRILPGASYVLAVPIETEGSSRGLLVVGDKESRQGVGPFEMVDRRTLALFANQAAIALENAQLHRQALETERLAKELELAADIQGRLLPTILPEIGGYELKGWSRPARIVGGDYYNLLPLVGGKLGAVLADVSGKGMPAALMVSTLHSALGLLLDRVDIGADLISRLNRHIAVSSAPNKFITLMIAEFDPGNKTFKYVNAGHNPALVVRHSGEVQELQPKGMPLGIFPDGLYQADASHLDPGDLLFVYSDGITEAESPDNEQFGMDRLTDLLRENQHRPLVELVQTVDQTITAFAADRSQGDDQTVLIVRRDLE